MGQEKNREKQEKTENVFMLTAQPRRKVMSLLFSGFHLRPEDFLSLALPRLSGPARFELLEQ